MKRFAVPLAVGSLLVASCASRVVDLGEPRPADTTKVVPPPKPDASVVLVGCAEWNDQELASLRGTTCSGKCADVGADPYAIETRKELIAATAGQWLFCGAGFGPADAVGVEFEPGCRIAFLKLDVDGFLVRGVTAPYQGSYDIVGTSSVIELHDHLGATRRATVHVDHCPNVIALSFDDGAAVKLSSDVEGRLPPPL